MYESIRAKTAVEALQKAQHKPGDVVVVTKRTAVPVSGSFKPDEVRSYEIFYDIESQKNFTQAELQQG